MTDNASEDLVRRLSGEAGDRLVKTGLNGWWSAADENQKLAACALTAAATLGPMGQGLAAALRVLYSPSLPTSAQLMAVFWLTVLTLPVFLGAAALTRFAGKTSGPVLLILASGAAVVGGLLLGAMNVPDQLGDLYCYNDGTVLEHECRAFDSVGFVTEAQPNVGSPSRAPDVFKLAFSYTAEARGWVMAFSGVIGGLAAGYLLRREAEPAPS